MECEGEWIIENHMFLYHDKNTQGGTAARLTIGADRYDGNRCIGFDCAQLAAALKLDVQTVVSANHDGSLLVLGVANVTPTRDGTSARQYGFQIGDRKGALTIETGNNEGTA
jgi:hypothetical protein